MLTYVFGFALMPKSLNVTQSKNPLSLRFQNRQLVLQKEMTPRQENAAERQLPESLVTDLRTTIAQEYAKSADPADSVKEDNPAEETTSSTNSKIAARDNESETKDSNASKVQAAEEKSLAHSREHPQVEQLSSSDGKPLREKVLTPSLDVDGSFSTFATCDGCRNYVKDCNAHIDEVIRFLDNEENLHQERSERKSFDENLVTYDQLPVLFRPGLEVYAWRAELLEAFVISSIDPNYSGRDSERSFQVTAWHVDFDGTELGRAEVKFYVKPFKGEQEITSLPCFPTALYTDPADEIPIRRQLIERGRKFFEISKRPTYLEFTGLTCDVPRRKIDRPQSKPNPFRKWDNIDRGQSELDDENIFFLCSAMVYGYILKERRWCLLNVNQLTEPKIDANAIELLVLEDDNTKNLIKAICSNYTSRGTMDTYSADFIQGKGEGHIFLLHGPPGVGKTLTAECVAEYTERPLLPLTGGDIGSTAIEVERNLRKYLRRGQDWNAVVLLDEAIWKNNLRKLGKERRDVKVDYNVTKYIDNELLNLDWNGREIRNAFQTAVSLALFDSKHENERQAKESGSSERVIDAELTVDHIQQVVDMSDNFKKYINSTHGEDPATTAKFKKLRDDDFGNSKDY
ncbi:MAG: hypothetical protein Q9157_005175 [Trypethelium eluteriae]